MDLAIFALKTAPLAIAGLTLVATLWSIAQPGHRLWPPRTYTRTTAFIGWAGTLAFFAAVFGLGLLGWGGVHLPGWVRFGVGTFLIVVGNAAVWSEVIGIGASQTMGKEGQLKTGGLYRFSRIPQYVADICILLGWALLSASADALTAVIAGIAVLVAFPFAEESWLEDRYGAAYLRYKQAVRRFL